MICKNEHTGGGSSPTKTEEKHVSSKIWAFMLTVKRDTQGSEQPNLGMAGELKR